MILKFSQKIINKEWKSLILPFFSILLTGTIITTSFLLINSARDFIKEKNKEFLGGDISYTASKDFELETLLNPSDYSYSTENISKQISFSGLVQSSDKSSGANFKVIDDNYPLYGSVILKNGKFEKLKENEVYIDENLYKTLNTNLITFNNKTYKVKGIIESLPESLVGFSFNGNILMSQYGLKYSGIDLNLFRKEFITKIKLDKDLKKEEIEILKQKAKENNIRSQFGVSEQGGVSFGLDIIEKFLVIIILVISILSLVNVYSSVNYLSNRLRRSFAILTSIGLNIDSVYKILLVVNSYIIFLGTTIGIYLGYFLTLYIEKLVQKNFNLVMSLEIKYLELFYIFLIIFITSVFATIPVINRLRNISPKELLSHSERKDNGRTIKNIIFDVLIGILPITIAAIYLLDSFLYGLITMIGIICAYGGLMILYYYLIEKIYKIRNKFSFSLKIITAQKKFDGFFGLITFASLFIALVSVYNLSILRTSIEKYLKEDLSKSVPSTYILDVQKSQKESLVKKFPEITLFPNIRARIKEIDGVDIQSTLEKNDQKLDRELGREFNLTYRDYLLSNEKLIKGNIDSFKKGQVSVESDFAKRVGINIGSQIIFLIQGFEINTLVNSIREVDTRSGYPFFYFILPEEELSEFPKTFFGYANFNTDRQNQIKNHLAENLPNVSIIDTSAISKIGQELINVLLLIILLITIPPIILSSMLIVTILSSLSKDRKRDGARLMAIGKEEKYVRNFYIIESSSTVVVSSIFSYIFALILSNFIIVKYLKIDNLVYFDPISFYIFALILIGIFIISIFLWKKGNKSLKEYLNYEENN